MANLGEKLKMRRSPFRALLKQKLREHQAKYKNLSGKDIRNAKQVAQAVQSEIEHVVLGDGMDQMGINARHATRNTIAPEDVSLVRCQFQLAGGSNSALRTLRSESAKNAEVRMEDRKKKKEKEEEDKKNGVVREKKQKSERKGGKKSSVAVAGVAEATTQPVQVAA